MNMKKIILSVIICFLSLSAFSQYIPELGTVFQPVESSNPYSNPFLEELQRMNRQSNSNNNNTFESTPRQSSPNYEIIRGYRYTNGNWYKMNLKVFVKGESVYIQSYQDRNSSIWIDAFNSNAQQTSKFDGTTIYENFDFKARISNFMVYF